ncbi:glycoside hydrolase family 88 protein [Candidatus Sumerlaeota bacterium]|nr:glycoside hydrolase family 88 protein [Candidatus Sumerlaeota bacterium]
MKRSVPLILGLSILLQAFIHAAGEWNFDFGGGGAASGYTAVSVKMKYNPEQGFGWLGETQVSDDIQDKPDALLRDFCWSSQPAEFRIDLKPGFYLLSFTSGDMYVANHATQVELNVEGVSFPILTPGVGEYLTASAAFKISDDHLIIRIKSLRDNWLLNAMTISPAEALLPVTIKTKQFATAGAPSNDIPLESPLEPCLKEFLSNLKKTEKCKQTRIKTKDYLNLIHDNVYFFRKHQDEKGAIIDPYEKKEYQYATPAFALSAAALVHFDEDMEILESAALAMDWACDSLGKREAANHHEDFFPPMIAHALFLLEPYVDKERVNKWKQDLTFDPYSIYRMKPGQNNWNCVALSGEALFYYLGLRDNLDYPEYCLSKHYRAFTPWGMFRDHSSPALAYDLFPRMWLSDILASGYSGTDADQLAGILRKGAIASLFMQSPSGELPTGGRSAHHQWNEAEECALFEIYSLFFRAERNPQMAGVFKRAAHCAFLSMKRWQRPSGELFIVKNKMDPEKRHGYQSYSSHSQYNLLAMAMLSIACEYAEKNSSSEEYAPSEIGGFILDLRETFHKVIANAGGMYVEIDVEGDLHYNPTGLIRIHGLKGNPQIGPSEGIVKIKDIGAYVAVGPAWMGVKKKDWVSLAEMGEKEIQHVSLNKLIETSEKVSFEIIYTGSFDGPFGITERYDITPEKVELRVSFDGYEGPARFQFPVLCDDGMNTPKIETRGRILQIELEGATQAFTALNADSLKLLEERRSFRNGFAQVCLAEYKSPQGMTLRIEPNRDWTYLEGASAVSSREPQETEPDVFDPDYIKDVMKKVFRYTADHPNTSQNAAWERAAFYTGVMGAYHVTKDEDYLQQAIKWSNDNNWELAKNKAGYWFGDNQTCAQTYLEIYFLQGGEEKIAHAKKVLDEMAANPPEGRKEWWWCDSLYMAPPVFVRMAKATGDKKYLDTMNLLWWDSMDFLYDKDAHLFYRDANFFPEKRKTTNNRKIFWARGNGWVLGGLARVLEYLPKDDPRYNDFVKIYRDMAHAVAAVQGVDGLWRTSLHDPAEWLMPETSGTGFFCFAMAWGVNNNLLEREKFLPVVKKAWTGLNRCAHPNGRLGWVQFVAGAPGPVSPHTMREYAPGAFLLSGGEMLKLPK